MAINTTTTRAGQTGDGTTTVFPVPFVFFGPDEIEVIERTIATGAEATKTRPTDYAVTGGNGSTGSVAAVTAPAATVEWYVRRKTKRTQETVYGEGDPFAAKTHERALDRALAISQEIEEQIGRSLQFPKTDPAAPALPSIEALKGRFIYVTPAGAIVGFDIATLGAIALPLSLAQGGTGATTAAAARAALGIADAPETTATITAGENLADRDQIYQDVFNQRGNGATRWYKIDADATGPVRISPRIGIALAAITAGNTGLAQVRPGRVAGFSGLTAGLPVFASATAGALTQTPPAIPASGAQIATRLIGYAASATEIDFDPDDDTVFTARSSAVAVDGTITVQHFPDAGAAERVPGAYLVAATTEGVIAGGTASAPVFGFAAGTAGNLTDNNSGTTADSGGTGDLTAASEANRRVFVVDYGSNKSLTKIELVSGRRASGAGSSNYGLYHSTDGSTWTQAGSNFLLTGTAATQTITVSATARYIALIAVAENQGTGGLLSGVRATELRAYELQQTRQEPVVVGGTQIDGAATDRVACRFDDGAGANADTRTTFVNRTNATRDLAVEVVL
jgi:hypothetical protein